MIRPKSKRPGFPRRQICTGEGLSSPPAVFGHHPDGLVVGWFLAIHEHHCRISLASLYFIGDAAHRAFRDTVDIRRRFMLALA